MNQITLNPQTPDHHQSYPNMDSPNMDTIDYLARTLYAEIILTQDRTPPLLINVRLLEGCASAIWNRYQRCGGSLASFFYDRFSCWHFTHPHYQIIMTLQGRDEIYRLCKRIARRAVNGALSSPVGNALRFHRKDTLPNWAKGRHATAEISDYWFY